MAILDADKEGFLRCARCLIQTMRPGGPQRRRQGDHVRRPLTRSMQAGHRRDQPPPAASQHGLQPAHGITPETIKSSIKDILASVYEADYVTVPLAAEEQASYLVEDLPGQITRLKKEMKSAAKKQEFEKAATIRDRIKELENAGLKFGGKVA